MAELPIQYGDFARWQREWLSGEVLERQVAYWRGQLAELPVLELPTDRAARGAELPGSAARFGCFGRVGGGLEGAVAARGCDVVHDDAWGV